MYLKRVLLIACGVLTGATLVFGGAAAARADGLDLTCSTRSGPVADIDTDEPPRLLDGVDIVFNGRAPASVPITGELEIDPATGDKLFTRTWRPTSGGTFYLDFLDAAGVEMSFLLPRPRVHSGDEGPIPYDLGLDDLLHENFRLPNDSAVSGHVAIGGLDLTVFASEALAALPEGIEGRFEVHVRFHRSDGTWTTTRISVGVDSRAPGADLPRRSDIGVAFKRLWTGGGGTPTDYILVGQHYVSWTEGTPKPGVGVRVNVDEVLSGPGGETVRPAADVDLDYSNVPGSMAVGLRTRCRPWDPAFQSTGHIAWNHSGLSSADAAATTMDLKVRTGVEAGLPVRIEEFDPILGGGWRDTFADEVDVDARIVGLPERLDWIMHPDSMGITRSTDLAPDLILNHAQLAQDDPATTDDKPIHAEGSVTGLPEHSRVQAGFGADGSIETLDMQFFDVACDSGAPEDDLFPPGPQGCRRADRVGIPEAHVLAQNWLPEDLIAQDAWAGMASPPLTQPQYVYYASRDLAGGTPVDLWSGAARLVGLRRAAYDSAGSGPVRIYADRDESYVDAPPWTPPGDCIPWPPYWECPPWYPADPDPAHVVIDVDGRTSDDEVANRGTRVEASGKVPDLPAAMRLEVETARFATKARWWASGDIEVDDGLVRATLPGPAATLVDAGFEIGRAGAGLAPTGEIVIREETISLPREICFVIAGRRICWPTGVTTDSPTGWRNVSFGVPDTPTDGFPTVGVPPDAVHAVRLKAGIVATSRDGRLSGTRIRAWLDASFDPGAVVRWDESDGSLAHVEGSFCESGAECANWFHGVVVSGPPEIREWEHLIEKPDLPAAPDEVVSAMPAFDDTWLFTEGESGVRVILPGPDGEWGMTRWGVEAFVEDVAGFGYTSVGNDVRVELADGAESTQAFNVDLLDASRRQPTRFGPGRIPLFVDARLDRLPTQMRLRMNASDVSSASAAPWIWVNTEDVDITDPADVDWDLTDEPGSLPRLTGVVRMGYTSMLGGMPAGGRPAPARSMSGADVWARFASSGPYAVDVVADLEVPRHVAIWKPSLEECNATQSRDRVAACQSRPLYEMDEWQEVRTRLRTTVPRLGDLTLNGRVAGDGFDYGIDGAVEHVPGSLDAAVRLTQNKRLPWLEATVDIDANAPLGDVSAYVTDNRLVPAEYRLADGSTRPTPNYAAVLRNVPADVNISARIYGTEERITPDAPPAETCHASSGRLGFLHAVADLGDAASDVDIDVHETAAGLAADLRADAPISGWVNARIDDLVFCESRYEDESAFQEHMNGGGIFGSSYAWMVPGVALVDVILGGIADLILATDADADINLDADLPVYVGFDDVVELRVAQNQTTLSIDERHGDDGGDPTTIAVRQRSLPGEDPFEVDGAWFRHRDVILRSTEWGLEDFDIRNSVDHAFADIGLHRWQRCLDSDEQGEDEPEHTCYKFDASRENVGTVADFPTRSDRGADFTSADIVLDPLFSAANRDELYDEDDGFVEPGRIFYNMLADRAPAADASTFVMPELQAAAPRVSITDTFRWAPTPYVASVYRTNCSEAVSPAEGAVGSDGTRYGFGPLCALLFADTGPTSRADAVGAFGLAAESANGVPRWVVALPDPVGFDAAGDDSCELSLDRNCRVAVRVVPGADGSVQVTLTSIRPYRVFGLTIWRPFGTKYAWLDASGQPANHLAGAAQVPNLRAPSFNDSSNRSGVATLDPCAIATWACASPPAGHTIRWIFGDGELSEPSPGTPTAVVHDYPSTRTRQSYYGMLLHLDPDGEVVDKAPFLVNAGGWSIFDGSWGWPWPLGG